MANGLLQFYSGASEDLVLSENDGSIQKSNQILSGTDFKGEIILLGATLDLYDSNQIHIVVRGDKKNIVVLRTLNSAKIKDWHDTLKSEIDNANVIALQNGTRTPEVIEWYYQYQSKVYKSSGFLEQEISMEIVTKNAAAGNVNLSNIRVCMMGDRQGLLLRIPNATRSLNRTESFNNGRVLPFQDIIGTVLPNGFDLSQSKSFDSSPNYLVFRCTLITREDELEFEMGPNGVTWLNAVESMVFFKHIPQPVMTHRNQTYRYDSGMGGIGAVPHLTSVDSNMEFSATSTVVFTCSSDVQLILEAWDKFSEISNRVVDIGKELNQILSLLTDVKCNKEASLNFGFRVEEITRVLGDQSTGIFSAVLENTKFQKSLLLQLPPLLSKLQEIKMYIKKQTSPGWLLHSINGPYDHARFALELFDSQLIYIVNILIQEIDCEASASGLFEIKLYDMMVDVNASAQALGGIERIFGDPTKERALAHIIQSERLELHIELELMSSEGDKDRRSSLSFASYQSSMANSRSSFSFSRYYCCSNCTWGFTNARSKNGQSQPMRSTSITNRNSNVIYGRKTRKTEGLKTPLFTSSDVL